MACCRWSPEKPVWHSGSSVFSCLLHLRVSHLYEPCPPAKPSWPPCHLDRFLRKMKCSPCLPVPPFWEWFHGRHWDKFSAEYICNRYCRWCSCPAECVPCRTSAICKGIPLNRWPFGICPLRNCWRQPWHFCRHCMHNSSALICPVLPVSAWMYLHAWWQRSYLGYLLLPANRYCRIASFFPFSLVICHSSLLLRLVLLFSWQDTEQSVFRQSHFLPCHYRCRDRYSPAVLHIFSWFLLPQRALHLPWKPVCNLCVPGAGQQMTPHR